MSDCPVIPESIKSGFRDDHLAVEQIEREREVSFISANGWLSAVTGNSSSIVAEDPRKAIEGFGIDVEVSEKPRFGSSGKYHGDMLK
jgi:hypothetical protein